MAAYFEPSADKIDDCGKGCNKRSGRPPRPAAQKGGTARFVAGGGGIRSVLWFFVVGRDCLGGWFYFRCGGMISTRRRLEYASGYLGLGMHRDAAAELGLIEGEAAVSAEVLHLWVALHQETKQWVALIEAATALAEVDPEEEHGWISWAYALRELDRVREAQEVLLKAEGRHGKSCAVLHYNLACYACLLGDRVDAKRRLATAIAMDAEFKCSATEDPDLQAMRDDLESIG